jgi:hypothetical protein
MSVYEMSAESWLGEYETDADFKKWLRKQRNFHRAVIMRIFSTIATPLPGEALPPPTPVVVEPDRQKRGGQGGSGGKGEPEFAALPEGAVMEHLGSLAAATTREADAEAYVGALPMLAATLVPSAAPAIIGAAPVLVGGMSSAARILRESQATRDLVRSLPNVAHRTAQRIGRRANSGRPITPTRCARILADTAVEVLSESARSPEALSESQYDGLTLRALRILAKKSREAAAALWDRYQKMSDVQLRPYARRDAMARAVLDQRYPSNEEALRRALGRDYRPPHSATVIRYRPNSAKPWRRQLTSGNATPEEKRLFPGWRERMLATHTEARAVRMANLRPGDRLVILGQYNPCEPCRRAMQQAAQRSGATIRYSWMGGTETFPR